MESIRLDLRFLLQVACASTGACIRAVPGHLSYPGIALSDPCSRLTRAILGARFLEPRAGEDERMARADAKPEADRWAQMVPARTRAKERAVRPMRGQVDPSPNAPKLIRLARHKLKLVPDGPDRARTASRRVVRTQRLPLGAPMREACAARVEPTTVRPMTLHTRPVGRPRLSAADFLHGREEA